MKILLLNIWSLQRPELESVDVGARCHQGGRPTLHESVEFRLTWTKCILKYTKYFDCLKVITL